MAWRRPGDKPLSEPMMVFLLTHICVTQLQWDIYVCVCICIKDLVNSLWRNNVILQYTHWGHWWRRLQPTSSIITDAKSVDSNQYDFAMQGWRRINHGVDVITGLSRQRAISRYLQDISTYLSCTAQRVLRTISMQNYKPKYACLPSKIVEVWIDRLCVRYDWWRRLHPTSSVSLVWI